MEYKITMDNFETEVLEAGTPVLVDFYADWCGPCKMMAPVVAAAAEKYDGRLKVGKCNIEENLPLAQKYRVVNIPTIMIFQNGQPKATFVGAMSPDEFEEKIEQELA